MADWDDETSGPDDDAPLSDMEAQVHCPWCGEPVDIALDPGSGTLQEYVEDCQVCCQPWRVTVTYDRDGQASVQVDQLDA